MKNYLIILALVVILFAGCKGKKQTKQEQPISALSIIKGQLNGLDKSIYSLTKYETVDGVTDTGYLKREEIRGFAAPFLSLPEIADKEYLNNYTEDRLIDAEQETLNITSTAKNENAEIQKQIIVVALADGASGKVQSIFIDRYLPSKDSTIEQKLYWEMDKYFSITSMIQKDNHPDKTHRTVVAWQ